MGLAPANSVVAGSADITSTVRKHLASLLLSSSLDGSADILEIVLDDATGRLAVPDPGRELRVSLGYKETGLAEMGVYVHAESRANLVPARLTVRATAADLTRRSEWKTQRTRAWHDLTLPCDGAWPHMVSNGNRALRSTVPWDARTDRLHGIDEVPWFP